MQIREAIEDDIPCIVNLLKISLGESLMPKSETFWRWKHIENPFGRSPVLLALEGERLIGVRAFMRWEWTLQGETIRAVRAVDTATHPDYQGKGIFSKLTLQLVEQCKAEGVHFIFNSPNKISLPGYLKMGWESVGRMRLFIRPVLSFIGGAAPQNNFIKLDRRLESAILFQNETHSLVTKSSIDFLNWRYASNPNVKYHSFQDDQANPTYITIYRLKPYRFGTEFRICGRFNNSSIGEIRYQAHLNEMVKHSGANLVTASTPLEGLFSLRTNRGPEITIRKLSSLYNSLTFNNWSPTLGDIEVF